MFGTLSGTTFRREGPPFETSTGLLERWTDLCDFNMIDNVDGENRRRVAAESFYKETVLRYILNPSDPEVITLASSVID